MKLTYANDGRLANYPFAAGFELPFPRGTILAMGVSLEPIGLADTVIKGIFASAVEIRESAVSVSLSGMDSGNYLCTVSAEPGKASGTFTGRSADGAFEMSCWLLAGHPARETSCRTYLPLDPSCVSVVPSRCRCRLRSLVVNGREIPVGPVLRLATAGLLKDGGYGTPFPDAVAYADIPEGTRTYRTDRVASYDKITGINQVSSPDSLTIRIRDAVGGGGQPAIAADLSGDLKAASDLRQSDPDWELPDSASNISAPSRRTLYGEAVGDAQGDCITLTLIGTREFPSCYARDKDEADSELPR